MCGLFGTLASNNYIEYFVLGLYYNTYFVKSLLIFYHLFEGNVT